MGSLDAHKDKNEIYSKIVDGDWKTLFPKAVYEDVTNWFSRQKDEKRVAVRFTFCNPPNNDRYAMYAVCSPKLKKDTVQIYDFKLPGEHPLTIPVELYEIPLFCMPKDLLKRILMKGKRLE